MDRQALAQSGCGVEPMRSRLAAVAITVLPIAVILGLVAAAPGYFDPMLASPPDWLGIPLGVILMAIGVGWGGLGGVLVARSSSPLAVPIGLAVFPLPPQ